MARDTFYGLNMSQDQWDQIFGKKKESPKDDTADQTANAIKNFKLTEVSIMPDGKLEVGGYADVHPANVEIHNTETGRSTNKKCERDAEMFCINCGGCRELPEDNCD